MISHKHKFVFIDFSKIAGTSLEDFLRKLAPDCDGRSSGSKWGAHFFKRKDHVFNMAGRKQDPTKLMAYTADAIAANYFKFCFVRNPWDKMVSWYFYMRKVRYKDCPKTFKDWVCGTTNNLPFSPNSSTRYGHIESEFHILPHITDRNGKVFLDFIGRFENIENDVSHICKKVGLRNAPFPHHNKSKHKKYWKHYDNEAKEAVAKKFAKDIEYFGYKFGE